MNIKGYVPVEVQGNRDYLWYLGVLNLNLSELLELREELRWFGANSDSIRILDGYIRMRYNIYVNNDHYYDNDGFGYRREIKKETKIRKMNKKRKSKERNGKYGKY